MEAVHQTLYVREIRADKREVDWVASDETVDSHDSIIRQNWRLDRWKKNAPILWAHDNRSIPIGQASATKVDKKRLLLTVKFAGADVTPVAEQVFQGVVQGFIKAGSVGFWPHKVSFEEIDGREVTVLDDNELLEFSLLPIGSNENALANLRARALAERGGVVREGDVVVLPKNVAGLPPKPPAERGEQKENQMDLEKENAALKAKLEQRDADVASREKTLTEERSLKAGLERDLALANTKLAERDTELKTLKDEAIVREVDALVGNKISKAERDDELESARINIANFRRRMANRPNLGGGDGLVDEKGHSRSVLGDDAEGAKRAPATGADASDHDKTFSDFEKSLS